MEVKNEEGLKIQVDLSMNMKSHAWVTSKTMTGWVLLLLQQITVSLVCADETSELKSSSDSLFCCSSLTNYTDKLQLSLAYLLMKSVHNVQLAAALSKFASAVSFSSWKWKTSPTAGHISWFMYILWVRIRGTGQETGGRCSLSTSVIVSFSLRFTLIKHFLSWETKTSLVF